VRCVAFYIIIIIIIINGFLMTQRQTTLRDIYAYIVLGNFIGHVMSDPFLADTICCTTCAIPRLSVYCTIT